MEFINKKEEVLDVILTQKGKELYIAGKFKPEYYSFYDNDIIYDSENGEEQNASALRIKDASRLKQIGNIQFHNPANKNLLTKEIQYLYCELGDKAYGNQYKPAWQIEFISSPPFQYVGDRNSPTVSKGYEIKESSIFDKNPGNQETIPQIDILTLFQLLSQKDTDNYYFTVDDPLLIGIEEENALSLLENDSYEIEAYWVDYEGVKKEISFNPDSPNNVFKYVNFLTDESAGFQQKVNIKDIYGKPVNEDDSTCQ